MRIVVTHNDVNAGSPVDASDVLVQRDAVSDALQQLGHQVNAIPASLDLRQLSQQLCDARPDVVFNLVESLADTDRWIPMVPLLLDGLGIPYTGSPTRALLATTDKLFAKQTLRCHGLPTPPWLIAHDRSWRGISDTTEHTRHDRAIIKSIWEHASYGLDDSSVVACDAHVGIDSVVQHLVTREAETQRPQFAEWYIAGREFNLSLFALRGEPSVLPPAEIEFLNYPPEKPRIVGYQAKWELGSFEYENTPRTFDFRQQDQPLRDQLHELAIACWSLFDLRGYARVDFRVDKAGQPWILEINANPCLSPDAGFAAAINQAGRTFPDIIQAILDDAISERPCTKQSVA